MQFYTSVVQYKNKLLVQGYQDGQRVLRRIPYCPYLFVPGNGGYSDIYGSPLEKVEFDDVVSARTFISKYSDVPGFKLSGLSNWPYQYIYHEFVDIESRFIRDQISVVSLDIETDSETGFGSAETADKEITSITISKQGGNIVTLGIKDFDASKEEGVEYFKCKNEKHLLISFLHLWNSPRFSPDVITGWNIDGYDIPYIINRINIILGEGASDQLSPWGIIQSREFMSPFGKMVTKYTIVGVASLDYMELYIKFIVPAKGRPESMRLDYIASEVLGIRKLDYSEYGDLATLYRENPQLFYEYNIRDVRLIDQLDQKLSLIDIAFAFAYEAGINFQDVFGTIRPWDATIHRFLMDQNIVMPFAKRGFKEYQITGGYVPEPAKGLHEHVVSIDLSSSYPHQIMQYNIGPETYIDKIDGITSDTIMAGMDISMYATDNISVSGNGVRYSKDKISFLSTLVKLKFDKRKYCKKLAEEAAAHIAAGDNDIKWVNQKSANDNKQQGIKVLINGLYGSLANIFSRWFSTDMAESITQSGQLAVKWSERAVNNKLKSVLKQDKNYVILIDTDSNYICLADLVDLFVKDKSDQDVITNFIDNVMKQQILPHINKEFDRLVDVTNAIGQKMSMSREIIASKMIITGKKHYVIKVLDQEGIRLNPPKTKITGIEAIRSSTAGAARERIKQAIEVILNQDEISLQSYIRSVKEEFRNLPLDEIATPKAANDIDKWTDPVGVTLKGTPIQAKAAIYHNILLKKLDIIKYPELKSGDKLKFVYLKKHNPYDIDCIGFLNILPSEFGLDEYIDRDKQFEKGFLKPMQTIASAIGWSTIQRATLDKFFT